MATQRKWKLVAVLTVLVVYGIVRIHDIVGDYQADASQVAQHECKSDTNKCHPYAYCYGNDTSYVCMCVPGWNGDGFVGDGHSGCQRRQVSKSQQTAFIIAFILATLVLLWFLVDAILGCIRRRARVWNNAQVALAQQAYPHQGVAPDLTEVV